MSQWTTTCAVNTSVTTLTTALAGANPTVAPPTFAADSTKYTQDSVWVAPTTGNTQGDQANAGSYNQGGFGYSTSCPMTDFTFSSIALTIPSATKGCVPLSFFYYICIGFALYRAAKITAGSNE